jgi:transposase-like protein
VPRRGAFSARESRMDQQPKGACPECGSVNYTFRSRKQIDARAEKGPELVTKFRCKDCDKEWKERVPGLLKKAPPTG